jgi:hypothetical protein
MKFHAILDSSTGEITVAIVPVVAGVTKTFAFKDLVEMRNTLFANYEPGDVERLIKDLTKFGSADFYG